MVDTENPVDESYNELNSLVELEGGKFSLPVGGTVTTAGVDAVMVEFVMLAAAVVVLTSVALTVALVEATVDAAAVEATSVRLALVAATVVVGVIMAGQQVSSKAFFSVQASLDS